MSWLARMWLRIRRWRRISAAKSDKTPLREFVYLDEVSVYSLLASRKGPLATEYTDIQEASQSGELASAVGANTGVVRANTSSKFVSSQTQTSQVLRKSTIQAAFKELREGEEGKLAIAIIPGESKAPESITWANLERLSASHPLNEQWLIDPSSLTRGQLFEMAVELEADKVFRTTAMISAMRNIVQENQELFPATAYQDIQKIEAINRVLDSLLVGLVPLRCRVVDYRVVGLGGKKMLVHNRLLAQLPSDARYATEAFYVVGVTEQRLFWKDIRRVLFSNLQFRMMCRINRNGLQVTWVPVKLFDVLRDALPDLADELDVTIQAMFATKELPASQTGNIADRMARAFVLYGVDLAERLDGQVDTSALTEIAARLAANASDYDDVEAKREAFSVIADYVMATLGIDSVDPMLIGQLRSNALIESGSTILGGGSASQVTTRKFTESDIEAGNVIDTEIVAIYW